MMTMMMYTPQPLTYAGDRHLQMEFKDHQPQDHIMQAFDNVAQAYHSTGPTRVTDTEAAMSTLWQLFRGGASTVEEITGAKTEHYKARQEDHAQLLDHMLRGIQRQLHDALLGKEDESENIFQAMLRHGFSFRTRCPGTQDSIRTNLDEKQRRPLEGDPLFALNIPDGDSITLRDCIANMIRESASRWCTNCEHKGIILLRAIQIKMIEHGKTSAIVQGSCSCSCDDVRWWWIKGLGIEPNSIKECGRHNRDLRRIQFPRVS